MGNKEDIKQILGDLCEPWRLCVIELKSMRWPWYLYACIIEKSYYNKNMGKRLYLDNCCFNRPYDDQSFLKNYLESEAKIFIQKEILRKNYDLAWSYMMDYEISFNPFVDRKTQILKWKSLAVVDINESEEIINLANEIQKKNIKPKDSLHLSCAIKTECEFFITTDVKILKKPIDNITVVDPIDFIKLLEV